MASNWEKFYADHKPPEDLELKTQQLREFCDKQKLRGRKIALVTVRL